VLLLVSVSAVLALSAAAAWADTLRVGSASGSAAPSINGGLVSGTEAVLESDTLGQVRCSVSTFAIDAVNNPGTPVTGDFTSVVFDDCQEQVFFSDCDVVNDAGTVPWTAELTTATNPDSTTVKMGSGEATVTCLGGAISCTYQGAGGGSNHSVTGSWTNPSGGNHARANFNGVSLTSSDCLGDNATWTGSYDVLSGTSDVFLTNP
jgi:hypothetical protein